MDSTKRTIRTSVCVLLVVFGIVAAFSFFGFVAYCRFVAWIDTVVPARFREVVNDPGAEFTELTGLPWPRSAKVIACEDTHGGFHGDGEFYLVFQTDKGTLKGWLAKPPPWKGKTWVSGPIPSEIGIKCCFGPSGEDVDWVSDDRGSRYAGDRKLVRMLSSRRIQYVAKETCCASMRWHNGQELIIDVEAAKVWLCIWDF